MNILDKIVAHKYTEIAERSLVTPIRTLEQSSYFTRQTYSLRESLLNPEGSRIMPDFRRR